MSKYKITAEIVDRENGMREFSDVQMIRVVSNTHNLLIMEDYLPVIGEVNGFVEVVTGEDAEKFSPIHGFYMHKKNHFYLLIDRYLEKEAEDGSGN